MAGAETPVGVGKFAPAKWPIPFFIRTAATAFLLALLHCDNADAARVTSAGTFELDNITYEKLVVSGPIEAGDTGRLERSAGKGLENGSSLIVSLNSGGGDYREGLKLAEYFLANDIATVVEDGAACLSACAIAFLGGVRTWEEGITFTARSISPRARLGFHAPFLNVERRLPSDDEISRAYDKAVKTITDFIRISERLNITPAAAADMMTPQRDQLFYINTMRDALYVDLEIQGIVPPKALTESMAVNLCINSIVDWGDDDVSARSELHDVADETGWSASHSTRKVRTDRFGEGVVTRRTVIPAYYAGEGSGYYFCVIDHALVDGDLGTECRGLAFLDADSSGYDTLFTQVDRAEKEGTTEEWKADVECRPTGLTFEPVSGRRGNANRWALAPKSTPISELSNVLERYAKSEKPL